MSSSRAFGLARAMLLLGMAVYLGSLWWSEAVGNYVHVRFGWLAVLGSGLALVLGLQALGSEVGARLHAVTDNDEGESHEHTAANDHADHQHAPLGWAQLALLVVPLGLGVLVPPQPLGAAAVAGDIASSRTVSEGAAIPATDSLQWTVVDWLRLAASGREERLSGKPADVRGFVYRQEGDPEGHFIVARFLMVHCTADAYAVGMPVAWPAGATLPADTWVQVRGRVQMGDYRGDRLPVLVAASVDDRVERPKQVYLYQ